jgi:hypothetical protein
MLLYNVRANEGKRRRVNILKRKSVERKEGWESELWKMCGWMYFIFSVLSLVHSLFTYIYRYLSNTQKWVVDGNDDDVTWKIIDFSPLLLLLFLFLYFALPAKAVNFLSRSLLTTF